MPVFESEKLGVAVLGCRFSEKAEHVPIKKRRFLLTGSSPPRSTATPASEGTERHPNSPNSSTQGLQSNPHAPYLAATSVPVTGLGERGGNDNKLDEHELLKASKRASEYEDFSGMSILAAAACSDSLGGDADRSECSGISSSGRKSLEAEIKENTVKSANVSAEETDSHASNAPFKSLASSMMDNSSPDKSALDDSSQFGSLLDSKSVISKTSQEASRTQKSSAPDVRLHWDLNTVMDAWEEPSESAHITADAAGSNVTYAEEEKQGHKKDFLRGCEIETECGSISKSIGKEVLPDGCANISELLSPEVASASHVVKKIESSHAEHINNCIDGTPAAIPSTLMLEHPAPVVSAFANCNYKSTDDKASRGASTDLSMDFSLPPGFENSTCAREKNIGVKSEVVDFQNNLNYPITAIQTAVTSISQSHANKQNLSLVTVASPENEAQQNGGALSEGLDEARLKFSLSCNGSAMEDLSAKGTVLPQQTEKRFCQLKNQESVGALIKSQSSILAEGDDQQGVSSTNDGSGFDAKGPINAGKTPITVSAGESMMLLTGPSCRVSHDLQTEYSNNLLSYTKETCELPLDNSFSYENSRIGVDAGRGGDKVDDMSIGYDSQYEDGELRESSMHTWEAYEGDDGENEYGNNRGASLKLGTIDAPESLSSFGPEGSSRIRFTDVGSGRGTDAISGVPLPEALHGSDQISGSQANEMIGGEGNDKRQDIVVKDADHSEWKMNVSGWDLLPENSRSSLSNFTKTRDFRSRRFSSREHKYGSEIEDVETKTDGSRHYRRESLSRIGGPSTRDSFLNRGRFRIQGFSSNDADDSTPRHEREYGTVRSFGRGRYSPHRHASGRRGDTWNRSPERDREPRRLHSPTYQRPLLRHSVPEDVGSVDNMTKEEPGAAGRPDTSSYVTRRTFRSRSPNREENEFRARLGLRPTEESHDRFVNVGRGRSSRYGSRFNGGFPKGRFHGPASDDCGESSIEYSHPFPRRRRCFSPIERRGNQSYRSDSRSPSRSRTRSPVGNGGFRRRNSRSPNPRSGGRMRRPRSPNYRRGFEAEHESGYHMGPQSHTSPPPPNSRWNYKQRTSFFDRRSPPPGRIDPPRGERFSFYDSSRKPKQNEHYRSGHPGRFSDINGGPRYVGNDGDRSNQGYRRGGFVRRYDMDRSVKRFAYDDEDNLGLGYDARDKEALEFHGRGNHPKPYSNATDSRFRDFPRRPREDKEAPTTDFQRRSREERESMTANFQTRPREEEDSSPLGEREPREEIAPMASDLGRMSKDEKDPSVDETEVRHEREPVSVEFQRGGPMEEIDPAANQGDDKSTNFDAKRGEVVEEGGDGELGSTNTAA